jgi:hypothetical protein
MAVIDIAAPTVRLQVPVSRAAETIRADVRAAARAVLLHGYVFTYSRLRAALAVMP